MSKSNQNQFEIAVLEPSELSVERDGFAEVWALVIRDLSPATRARYDAALRTFAKFFGAPTPWHALRALADLGRHQALIAAYHWRDSMEANLAPNTIKVRLAAFNRVCDAMYEVGALAFVLRVKPPKATELRDTRGHDLLHVRRLFDVANSQSGIRRSRDLVVLALVFLVVLRRAEASRPDVIDFEPAHSRMKIWGKGKHDWQWISLPLEVTSLLVEYLAARDAKPNEPLVMNISRNASQRGRLSPNGFYRVVRRLGKLAGIEVEDLDGGSTGIVSPHRLRHSGITLALDVTSGDVRRVQRFSRHERLQTVMTYDDRRRDPAGEIASLVVTSLGAQRLKAAQDASGVEGETGPDHGDPPGDHQVPPGRHHPTGHLPDDEKMGTTTSVFEPIDHSRTDGNDDVDR